MKTLMVGPTKTATALTGLAIASAILSYSVLFAEKETIVLFAAREALAESLGAILLLVTALLSLATFITVRGQQIRGREGRAYFYLLLTIFFVVAFGEEISWGTLGMSKQARVESFPLNIQNELNIHNFPVFDEYTKSGERKKGIATLVTANRLFDYFMLTAFVLLPLAVRKLPTVDYWTVRLGIPILPGLLSLGLATNWALTIASEALAVDNEFMHGAVSEIREFNYAVLCLLGILYLYLTARASATKVQSPL